MIPHASIIKSTEQYIRNLLEGEGSGHDWWHVYRVWTIAKRIAAEEKGANIFVVEMAALLHDLGDYKLSATLEETAEQEIIAYLQQYTLPDTIVRQIVTVVDRVSFSKNVHRKEHLTLEAQIVQDADRLDAIGAIGIARTFAFGGAKGRQMYDPHIKPLAFQSVEDRRKNASPTINHFYEKLLLIKDLINTKTAKKIAEERHTFMEKYLEEFYKEWEGKA